MNSKSFNPEAMIQHLEPDPNDPGAPVAYVCGVPVERQEEEEVEEADIDVILRLMSNPAPGTP